MNIFMYDKTFEGLLTVVYESYYRKLVPQRIISKGIIQDVLWCARYDIKTDPDKADRVWKGLLRKVTPESAQALYRAFLSESNGIEMVIYRYLRKTFDFEHGVEFDFADQDVLQIAQMSKKVAREAQRVQMFIRFQKTADGIYFAAFDPSYNVLPIIIEHFTQRFADQKWVIYDTRRKFGFYYDLTETTEIKIENSQFSLVTGQISQTIADTEDQLFQDLWKQYFKSICIEERKNPKLQKQFMPKRFWKYLPEKMEHYSLN